MILGKNQETTQEKPKKGIQDTCYITITIEHLSTPDEHSYSISLREIKFLSEKHRCPQRNGNCFYKGNNIGDFINILSLRETQ